MPVRWVGIDEAGYGPNLGPLVMTAVVAESDDERPLDLWSDLAATVCRAREDPARLWVDDSKALYSSGKGRDRLDAACLALAAAAGCAVTHELTFGTLLEALNAGCLETVELAPWLSGQDPPFPCEASRELCERTVRQKAFDCGRWRITAVQAEVVGPARFNEALDRLGNKSYAHFDTFSRLVQALWERAADGVPTYITGDKHGGRHFYYGPLMEAFPDAWVDRGVEGPELSRYTVRQGERRLELSLRPRADAGDGLVALASVASKSLREHWMEAFNAHWLDRIPGLKPTAGYPVDARRFRAAIEPHCLERGIPERLWWRAK